MRALVGIDGGTAGEDLLSQGVEGNDRHWEMLLCDVYDGLRDMMGWGRLLCDVYDCGTSAGVDR